MKSRTSIVVNLWIYLTLSSFSGEVSASSGSEDWQGTSNQQLDCPEIFVAGPLRPPAMTSETTPRKFRIPRPKFTLSTFLVGVLGTALVATNTMYSQRIKNLEATVGAHDHFILRANSPELAEQEIEQWEALLKRQNNSDKRDHFLREKLSSTPAFSGVRDFRRIVAKYGSSEFRQQFFVQLFLSDPESMVVQFHDEIATDMIIDSELFAKGVLQELIRDPPKDLATTIQSLVKALDGNGKPLQHLDGRVEHWLMERYQAALNRGELEPGELKTADALLLLAASSFNTTLTQMVSDALTSAIENADDELQLTLLTISGPHIPELSAKVFPTALHVDNQELVKQAIENLLGSNVSTEDRLIIVHSVLTDDDSDVETKKAATILFAEIAQTDLWNMDAKLFREAMAGIPSTPPYGGGRFFEAEKYISAAHFDFERFADFDNLTQEEKIAEVRKLAKKHAVIPIGMAYDRVVEILAGSKELRSIFLQASPYFDPDSSDMRLLGLQLENVFAEENADPADLVQAIKKTSEYEFDDAMFKRFWHHEDPAVHDAALRKMQHVPLFVAFPLILEEFKQVQVAGEPLLESHTKSLAWIARYFEGRVTPEQWQEIGEILDSANWEFTFEDRGDLATSFLERVRSKISK